MKRTDTVIKIVAALLFTALICYVGVYLFRSLRNPLRTAEAVSLTVRESATATGVAVRDELVIESGRPNLQITASEGLRISKGAPVAVSYGSAAAVQRASRIRELELEILRVKTLLSTLMTAEDLSARDEAVKTAIFDFSAAVSRHELDGLDGVSLRLRSLVFASRGEQVTEADLASLEQELRSLESASDVDIVPVSAPEAGIYTSLLDGYERLKIDDMRYTTPEELREIMHERDEVPSSAIGKLVLSTSWYFVSVMQEEDAALLRDTSGAALEFGRYYSAPVSAGIVSIGAPENGECTVIFSCDQALVETLAMRQVSAEVVYAEYTGIRVPRAALREDEDGAAYVYTLTGKQVERKDVTLVYEAADYCLVETERTADSLRAGNAIIVEGDDLYDGKVISS